MPLTLSVFEPRYRKLVADLLNENTPAAPRFGVVALTAGWEVGELKDVRRVGTTARVSEVFPHPDGRCRLEATGENRFEIVDIDRSSQPYLMAHVRYLTESSGERSAELAPRLAAALSRYNRALGAIGLDPTGPIPAEPAELSYVAARQPWLTVDDRQALLECTDVSARLVMALSIIRREETLLRLLRAVPVSAEALRAGLGSA